jgi:hypothetical protein
MTSAPVRDPLSDHLFTPQNAAFLLIDYQLSQLAGVRSRSWTRSAEPRRRRTAPAWTA